MFCLQIHGDEDAGEGVVALAGVEILVFVYVEAGAEKEGAVGVGLDFGGGADFWEDGELVVVAREGVDDPGFDGVADGFPDDGYPEAGGGHGGGDLLFDEVVFDEDERLVGIEVIVIKRWCVVAGAVGGGIFFEGEVCGVGPGVAVDGRGRFYGGGEGDLRPDDVNPLGTFILVFVVGHDVGDDLGGAAVGEVDSGAVGGGGGRGEREGDAGGGDGFDPEPGPRHELELDRHDGVRIGGRKLVRFEGGGIVYDEAEVGAGEGTEVEGICGRDDTGREGAAGGGNWVNRRQIFVGVLGDDRKWRRKDEGDDRRKEREIPFASKGGGA